MLQATPLSYLPPRLYAAGVLVLVLALRGFGQIDTGAIVGTVRDPSGAAIPKASVVVTNESTGVAFNTQTNNDGEYQVTALIPGTYSVKVTAPGFQSGLRPGIQIDVQSRPAIDFDLKVGTSTQTIEVTSAPPLLQTQTADVGAVVQTEQINDLPLNGRRYSDLSLLEAGITRNLTNTNNTAPDRFSSNGNWETQNYFALDGVDNNSGSTNLQESTVQVIQPPPDALQEFRIQTRTYSAEFGTAAGAVINASIKSGTNQFHGDLWEYLRNSELDANTYFNNQGGVPRGHFSQNQYGATIGGPIIKNRTFFFGDFQFFTSRTATTELSTVPTPLMKQGNFLELAPNTLKSSPVAGQAGCVVGSQILANCIDPTSAKLVALFPDPNIPSALALQGQAGSWTGAPNYQFQYSVPNDSHSWDVRIDHSINDRNRIFGRYSEFIISRQDPPWTSDPVAGNGNFATQYNIHEYSAALAWDDTIAPTLLNELRGGFTRDYAHSDPIGLKLGESLAPQYGLTGVPVSPQSAGIPPININGLTRLGSSPWRPQFQISQVWQLLDNLSWLKGNHSFKFGYEFRHPSDNFLDIESPQGQISVNGIYTNNGSFGLPDFLLGDVDSAQFTTPTVVHNYKQGNSFYGQDTWRARPNLTITYGLRYELFSPLLNHQNAVSNFTPANGGGFVTAAANASGWYNRALIQPDYNNWAPRFGFSYQPASRVVLRGGFGIYYQQSVRIGSESILALNPPFVVSNSLTQILGSTTPVFLLSNGFPSFASSSLYLPGIQVRAQDPNQRTPYVEQFSFGPQIQLGSATTLDITYVGNNARKMNRLRNANQGIVTGYDASGKPIVIFPYPNLNNNATGDHAFLELATNDGNSDYNAMLVSLRHRFSHGVSYGISYTWSHGISDFVDNLTGTPEPQNAYDYAADRGESPFDIRSRFVGFFTYELPFGNGKQWLNNNGWSGRVLGGWQVNSIVTLQTGTPFEVNAADASNTGGNHDSRADCIGNPFVGTSTDPRHGVWLNPDAFAEPALGTFGSCGARNFHGPGVQNVDLSLFKSFTITESTRLVFRAESFNLFNHANFTNPNSFYSPFSLGSFGRSFNTVTDPRELQFALKFIF